ncbi:MAG TPA: hypothetical protein VN214_08820, partial [Pseudomonas sp.]|nr:hypothetical protein [Pseudomonas sp.]
ESGFCPWHIPQRCKDLGIFSIRTYDFTFNSSKPIPANHAGEREGFMAKVPSQWRNLDVVNPSTGDIQTVQMRIAGIGSKTWPSNPPGTEAWGPRWSIWPYAPAPCQSTSYAALNIYYALWFWIIPEGVGTCARTALFDVASMRFEYLEYAYEIKTPNPLTMSAGQYNGSISYSIGPGQDFDFGEVMIPNDNNLTFNVTLDVEHSLKVEIPPGGNKVELLPQGGWQAWLNQGRKPTRLFRDQTFNLSASSRFKMQLECQYTNGGNTCSLREPTSGHDVPLNIRVSLPNGLTDATGQSVNRRPLLRDGSGTELFQPGFYVDRKPGTLHFDIDREHVEQMLTGGEKTYSGQVTVVWDSEV